MTGRITKRKFEAICWHEAGHAVAAYLLKIPFRSITTKPNGKMLGHVVLAPFPKQCLWINYHRLVERHVMVCHAGPIAQLSRFPRSSVQGAIQDERNAKGLLRNKLGIPASRIKQQMDATLAKTITLMTSGKALRAVHSLACALIEHRELSRTEARKVIREAIDQQW